MTRVCMYFVTHFFIVTNMKFNQKWMAKGFDLQRPPLSTLLYRAVARC